MLILGNGMQWNTTGVRVAGDGTEGSGAAQLKEPRCVYVDANDTVYVCDTVNGRIQKWPKGATTGTTVAGGSEGASSNQLKMPLGLTFDKNGILYVADTENHRIQKFSPGSASGTTLVGSSLNKPYGVAVDGNNNLYITDHDNLKVKRYNINTSTLTDVFSSSNKPYGIAFLSNSSNQFYVSFDSSPALELWTVGVSGATATLGSSSTHGEPKSIAVDRYNNVYVADKGKKQITMYCANSGSVKTIVGGSSNTSPSLDEPAGVAFDANMNLYVTYKSLASVYKFSLI
ncbi:unnamed protein product [Rotaria socialis]|uniref:Uncharacterized protein n=1 Tax=Rotaria socialis TaxID=392032 RepID=A0A818C8N3_9BILA|nr:unnamed protein product [Rotaria socialis]CAF3561970.1 unnamed protein product [Rotaria socialis]CAF4500585.1 unnamed protein product [Rotaria socialis]CAF4675169.1 unnamed protein product [Rotaria socialis]